MWVAENGFDNKYRGDGWAAATAAAKKVELK